MMKQECLKEFVELLSSNALIDEPLCAGYGFSLEEIRIGWEFYASPNFVFGMSTEKFTMEDALKHNLGNWEINHTLNHFSDKYVIIAINRRFTQKKKRCYVRVKNLRTNVDFDIIKNDFEHDEISNLATIEWYFTKVW